MKNGMNGGKDEVYLEWAAQTLGGAGAWRTVAYGDQSDVYETTHLRKGYFLKIAPALEGERNRLNWLRGKLPASHVIAFTRINGRDALLLSAIKGENLAKLKKEWPAQKVIDAFAEALQRFHATPAGNCPFGTPAPGAVLIHGDACLPNFIFKTNGAFSGYVDLGDMRVGDPQVDLAAAVWSIEHNLGLGYGLAFLKSYGIANATEALAGALKKQYEAMQKEWGLQSEQ